MRQLAAPQRVVGARLVARVAILCTSSLATLCHAVRRWTPATCTCGRPGAAWSIASRTTTPVSFVGCTTRAEEWALACCVQAGMRHLWFRLCPAADRAAARAPRLLLWARHLGFFIPSSHCGLLLLPLSCPAARELFQQGIWTAPPRAPDVCLVFQASAAWAGHSNSATGCPKQHVASGKQRWG